MTHDPTGTRSLVTAVLLCFVGVAAALPVLPGAVADAGGGEVGLGLALGATPVTALVGRFVAGRASDRRGRVTTVRAGMLGSVLSGVVLALPLPLWGIVAGRAVQGLADAVVYTAAASWVVDRVPLARRAQALSRLGAAIWGGMAVGPLVGAALGSLQRAGLLIAATSLLGLLALRSLPEPGRGAPGPGGLRGLFPRASLGPGIALGLGNVGYAAVVGFLVLHLQREGGNGALVLACFSASVFGGRLLVIPALARFGLLRVAPLGYALMSLALAVVAAADGAGPGGTAVVAVAGAVLGVGYCLPFPALATLVSTRVPDNQRGTAIGALTACYDVAVAVASLGPGLLADRAGTRAVFVAASVVVLLGALAVGLIVRGATPQERASGRPTDADVEPDL